MTSKHPLTTDQLGEICQHQEEVLSAINDANNVLIARLHSSKDLSDQDREAMNKWSQVINDIHTASEAHVMGIVAGEAPRGLQ